MDIIDITEIRHRPGRHRKAPAVSAAAATPAAATPARPAAAELTATRKAGWGYTLLGVTRLMVGFTFLWAFLDKTFGLGRQWSRLVKGNRFLI
ncbi:putative integral membrane protein [Brachybacterium sp. SW0106-09]|nr:putative integral membrane protein [Brachybacterium sp. SW0106-09]